MNFLTIVKWWTFYYFRKNDRNNTRIYFMIVNLFTGRIFFESCLQYKVVVVVAVVVVG